MLDAGEDEEPERLAVLRGLEWAAKARRGWRVAGGSMESITPEQLPDMSVKAWREEGAADGWQVEVATGQNRANGAARRIVTESMLFAGEGAAQYGAANDVPLPFRGQSMNEVPPPPPPLPPPLPPLPPPTSPRPPSPRPPHHHTTTTKKSSPPSPPPPPPSGSPPLSPPPPT